MNRELLMVIALSGLLLGCRAEGNPQTAGEPAKPSVSAQPDDAQELAALNLQICKKYSELAKSIMEARQGGIDMAKEMELSEGNKIATALVIEAYSEPRFNTPESQRRSATDFGNRVYLQCAKAREIGK